MKSRTTALDFFVLCWVTCSLLQEENSSLALQWPGGKHNDEVERACNESVFTLFLAQVAKCSVSASEISDYPLFALVRVCRRGSGFWWGVRSRKGTHTEMRKMKGVWLTAKFSWNHLFTSFNWFLIGMKCIVWQINFPQLEATLMVGINVGNTYGRV